MKMSNQKRLTKDKVLHTRIPEQLDQQIRDNAGRLGLSVSTVVRNVLSNTFDLVEDVVHDSVEIAKVMRGQDVRFQQKTSSSAEAAPPPACPIYGWQEITLNVNGLCQSCNGILPKGSKGNIAIPVSETPVFMCCDCLMNMSKKDAVEQSDD